MARIPGDTGMNPDSQPMDTAPLVMDAALLARVAAALVSEIAEAKVRATEHGIDSEFCEFTRHCRAMHVLLLDVLLVDKALSTPYYRGLVTSADNSIEQLEALAESPNGKMQ